jgi:hypothetical protein
VKRSGRLTRTAHIQYEFASKKTSRPPLPRTSGGFISPNFIRTLVAVDSFVELVIDLDLENSRIITIAPVSDNGAIRFYVVQATSTYLHKSE